MLLYVDDMLITTKFKSDIPKLKDLLCAEFEMKNLGATQKILGMKIYKDKDQNKIFLSQKGYIQKILSKFGMSLTKPIDTPSTANAHLSSILLPHSEA